MLIMQKHLRCFLLIWLIVFKNVLSVAPCAHFHFPNLDGTVLTANENTSVTLPFEIVDEGCDTGARFSLEVTKIQNRGKLQCFLLHINGQCVPSFRKSKCVCMSETGKYEFTHIVDRSDNQPAYWHWSTDAGTLEEMNITFNVLYPATVKSLSVTSQQRHITSFFEENASVEIVCLWENGNPPVTARLLDRHGVEMEGSIYSSGQIRYTFPAVSCQDAGLIRCEAPGASHNETATLLVKCRPQMWSVAYEQQTREIPFLEMNYRAHTADIQNCILKRLPESDLISDGQSQNGTTEQAQIQRIIQCSNIKYISGSPPDMTLMVLLDSIQDRKGLWRLELTNNAGTGYLDLELEPLAEAGTTKKDAWFGSSSDQALEPTTSAVKMMTGETRRTPQAADSVHSAASSNGLSHMTYMAAIIAVVLIVGIISISVSITIICVKKGIKTSGVPVAVMRVEEEAAVIQFRDHEHDDVSRAGSNQSTNTYEEIPDRNVLPLLEPPRPSRRHCQAPPPDPDDYLHPVPTPSDVNGEASSKDPASSQSQQSDYQNCSTTTKE